MFGINWWMWFVMMSQFIGNGIFFATPAGSASIAQSDLSLVGSMEAVWWY
jgi:hypothetical protein